MQECLLNETIDDTYSTTLSCEKAVERERGIQQLTNEYNRTSEYSFVIVGIANSARWIGEFECYTKINGQKIYNRLLIKRV